MISMTTMKNFFSMMMLATAMLAFTACKDDDGGDVAPDGDVQITGIPATAEIENLATLGPVTATITAEDGLKSLKVTKDGAAFDDETFTGETSATYSFSYTAVEADADQNIAFTFTATDADGDTEVVTHVLSVGEAPATGGEVDVTSNITEDVTWTSNNVYILTSRIIVMPGAVLTIEPGTLIKGEFGDGANATALIVARGAKIMAEGTADAPIIFTSIADEIMPGEIASPNLDETDNGLWGGLIILGDAPISDEGNDGTEQVEGVPVDEGAAEYGGTNAEDNSGVLKYVSIRHGGTRLGDGDEINGLTLGGIGSGTTIEFIEVVGNLDDGIEWFGGTVNVSNVLVWGADDDAIDIDQAYSGTINNAIVVSFSGTDHALEIDGPEGTLAGAFTLSNVTLIGSTNEIADFRAKATGTVSDVYIVGFVSPLEDINGSAEGGTGFGDLSLSSESTTSTVTFTGLEITLAEGATLADVFKNFTAEEVSSIVTAVDAGENTKGADVSMFAWTWAANADKLSGL